MLPYLHHLHLRAWLLEQQSRSTINWDYSLLQHKNMCTGCLLFRWSVYFMLPVHVASWQHRRTCSACVTITADMSCHVCRLRALAATSTMLSACSCNNALSWRSTAPITGLHAWSASRSRPSCSVTVGSPTGTSLWLCNAPLTNG